MESAEEIWNDLKARFFQGDLLRIFDLHMDAAQLKQGAHTISEYFTKLRIIWDALENFRPNPVCRCKGSCKVSKYIAQRKSEDKTMQFLRGLNEQYGNIKSHVLLMEPLPSISKIFSYVLQQERQLMGNNMISNLENKVVAIATNVTTCFFFFAGKVDTWTRKMGSQIIREE